MAIYSSLSPLSRVIADFPWPVDFFSPEDLPAFLDSVYVLDYQLSDTDTGFTTTIWLAFEGELSVNLPGLDGVKLVAGGGDVTGLTFVTVTLVVGVETSLTLNNVRLSLRFDPSILKPAAFNEGDPVGEFVEILVTGSFRINSSFDISVEGFDAVKLTPAMIGDSGVIVAANDVKFDLSRTTALPEVTAAGFDESFIGVFIGEAKVSLPKGLPELTPEDLILKKCVIGSGGVSGELHADYTHEQRSFDPQTKTFSGKGAGDFFGLPFCIDSVDIVFKQNALKESKIAGQIMLPYFDKRLAVEIGIDLNGAFAVKVAGAVEREDSYDANTGLLILEKENLIRVVVESITISVVNDKFIAKLSGKIAPLFGEDQGLSWPSFKVNELSIDSQGNVHLEGEWLDLPNQHTLDFHGFKLEIAKIGFGSTDDGGKWIGFTGGIKLVDALPAGASVEGLRLTWYDDNLKPIAVTLNGVGVEFEVPGVVKFKGTVSYSGPLSNTIVTPDDETVERFDGSICLKLIALNLEIDAVFVVGSATGVRGNYNFFAIYLGAELPAGIPLWSTGLGLYGVAGLFALQMEPNRKPDEKWYGVGPTEGWFKRNGIIGVTDLKTKWDPNPQSLAFGAGVTIGTVADNGFMFAGRVLLVIVLPGPIILLEGKANILKKRANLSSEPVFRSLAILDNRAGFVTIGLDAHYKYGKKGELIDIHGGVDAFYDFHDAEAWHIYLGEKEPAERRIGAKLFQFSDANGYCMIDSQNLRIGAWIGFDKRWTFGPLAITLAAWLEGNAVVSFKPPHFYGDVWLHGDIAARVYGFGLSIVVDATCKADVFEPLHLLFDFSVSIDLPWFLPDFNVNFPFEWGPQPTPPPLPFPLKEVAVEHFKVTTKWPLPRVQPDPLPETFAKPYDTPLLLPNYDPDGDEFRGFRQPEPTPITDPSRLPVVPLDSRPHLTFGRSINDKANIGINTVSAPGWEWIGDPSLNQGPVRAFYSLDEVALEKYVGGTKPWNEVACVPEKSNMKKLFGSWAPVPQLPTGSVAPGGDPPTANVKLWLWSKTPFDYTRHTSGAWDEWFTDRFTGYPCPQPPSDRTICCDFQSLPIGARLTSPWSCPGHPEVTLTWTAGVVGNVTALASPVDGRTRALCFPPSISAGGFTTSVVVTVQLPEDSKGAHITLTPDSHNTHGLDDEMVRTCVDFVASTLGDGPNPRIEQGVQFEAYDSTGELAPVSSIAQKASVQALDCAHRLEITLPCPAERVEAVVVRFDSRQSSLQALQAYDPNGKLVGMSPITGAIGQPERLTIDGQAITRVVVTGQMIYLLKLCYVCSPSVNVIGRDKNGMIVSVSRPKDGLISVRDSSVSSVDIVSASGVCITKVCVTVAPDEEEVQLHQQMTQHMVDELARWSQQGEVLEPNTKYRLKIVTSIEVKDWQYENTVLPPAVKFNGTYTQTEYAYFCTEGPPGLAELSKPVGATIDTFKSGLDDLASYVLQTVPPTVPAQGEKPTLPRPVYRAYDVGVRFNEDYVDLLYRIDQRDLGLYLYDNNNQPVRDASGRLLVLTNEWGKAESRTLTESEKRWISVVNASTCASLDQTIIPPDRTLTSAGGAVLNADTVYEARLVPLLLHDDFSHGITNWGGAVDEGTRGGPSQWAANYHVTLSGSASTSSGSLVTLSGSPDLTSIDPAFGFVILAADSARTSKRYRITRVDATAKTLTVDGTPNLSGGTSAWEIPALGALEQTSGIAGGTPAANDPEKPGTMLLRGDITKWTDYRLSVFLCSLTGGALGVIFRAKSATTYYRFSMDRDRKYRRLVRVVNGAHTILAEDDFVYVQHTVYLVTIEAVGDWLRVYQDGMLIFDLHDAQIDSGKVGLYAWSNAGAHFADIRVDDLSNKAQIVYQFKFTTSQYANFFHHLHSYQDETWRVSADVSTSAANAVATMVAPGEQEWRDYDALVRPILQAPDQNPPQVEVTRLDHNGQGRAFLLRSPEPIDWSRTTLELSMRPRAVTRARTPSEVKITDVSFGQTFPNEESVTLLLREALDLTGWSIERRSLPAGLSELTGDSSLFVDDFDGSPGGLLFHEDFGPNALDHYTIVDEGSRSIIAPHVWAVASGHIQQTGNYIGLGSSIADPFRPGTIALTGDESWENVRIKATLRTGDQDDIGLVFRFLNKDSYYRFSMSRTGSRLVKRTESGTIILWERQVLYALNQSYRLRIDAFGDRLIGYLNDALLFDVRDSSVRNGRIGFYCWKNFDAHFEALDVEKLEESPVLWRPMFTDLYELQITDEGVFDSPSNWIVDDGVLLQTSGIRSTSSGSSILPNGCLFILPIPYLTRRSDILYAGTYALGGRPEWEDIEVSAQLQSGADGAIGVMFRYKDPDNYYRLSIDRRNRYRRLVKKVSGVVTVLWEDSVVYTIGLSFELTIRSVGNMLWGAIDGVPLFTIYDGSLKRGRIGLYCANNPGARFERLLTTDRTRRVGRWTVHDDGTTGAPSEWRLGRGNLCQTSNIGGGMAPYGPGTYAIAGDMNWTDYQFSVQLRSDDDSAIGLIFRYVDADNYYRLSLDRDSNQRMLVRRHNGVTTILWSEQNGYIVGASMMLTVDAVDSRLVAYLNGTRLFDVSDETHKVGRIGVYCRDNPGARFERVEVRRLPLDAFALFRDRFVLGDMSGWMKVDSLSATSTSLWSVSNGACVQSGGIFQPHTANDTLSELGTMLIAGNTQWKDVILRARLESSTGQAIGVVFCYADASHYYRFSMDRQQGHRRLVKNTGGVSTLLWEDPTGYELGISYELTIVAVENSLRGFLDGVPLFVLSDKSQKVGAIGLYSWKNKDARFSSIRVFPGQLAFEDWLLDEQFNTLVPTRWSFVDEGTQGGPSQWAVSHSRLRQTSSIRSVINSSSDPDRPGTYAIAGDRAWSDYRFMTRLVSGTPDAIGVIFRYVDSNNYYQFSMDRAAGYRRLLKKVAGVASVLWEDNLLYSVGRVYLLTIDCVGELLRGYIDGVPLFSLTDSSHRGGRIGLYCWNNTAAEFYEVRMAAPVWAEHFSFSTESRRPAGSRVRVHSGHAWDMVQRTDGVENCFTAALDDNGRITFDTDEVTLRLSSPNRDVVHERPFLNAPFTSVPVKVLRKADATGVVIFPVSGSLDIGEYQLEIVYRRDNTAADAKSLVLRQAGQSSPEKVSLFIPWLVN